MCDSINCGFSNIDEIVGGFQASDLVVIGSRPGKGKSTFAKQIALNVAVDNQTPTMFFSPAESGMRFAIDLLCLECDRTQSWMEDHPDMVDEVTKDATERFSCAPLFIDDTPDLKIEDFLFKAKKMVKAKGIRLIIIDYVQFLRGPEPFRTNGPREAEMDCVAKSLKTAAEELKVPIIVLSQLQRGPDRPKMDDITDSKELKVLADVVILMHNGIGWDKIDGQITGEFIIAKNTHGNIGTVELTCDLEQGKFYEEKINDRVTMKAFRITPKRIRRSNGQVLTPEMSVVVSTNLSNPFNNGTKEVAEAYMRIYGFDYKRSCCCKTDFDCVLLG